MNRLLKSPLLPLLYGVIYLGAAWLLALGPSDAEREFWSSPQTRLWHSLLALQVVFWVSSIAAALPNFTDKTRSILPVDGKQRLAVAFGTLVALVMAGLPFIIIFLTGKNFLSESQGVATGLPYYKAKLKVLSAGGTLAAVYHVFGLLCAHVRIIKDFESGSNQAGVSQEAIARYQRLRSQVKSFLGSAAIIIGAATLSTGALRNLVNNTFPAQDPSRMPAVLVMAYGAYFTVLLAGVYLPVHGALERVGGTFLEKLRPGPPFGDAQMDSRRASSWKDWVEEQQALRTYLGLETGGLKHLQEGLSVLAPLIAGISSLLLEIK